MNFINDNKNYKASLLYKNLMDKHFLNVIKYSDELVKNYSDDYKLKLLDDLHKILCVEWFDVDLINKLKSNTKLLEPFQVDSTLYNQIIHKQRFNVRG